MNLATLSEPSIWHDEWDVSNFFNDCESGDGIAGDLKNGIKWTLSEKDPGFWISPDHIYIESTTGELVVGSIDGADGGGAKRVAAVGGLARRGTGGAEVMGRGVTGGDEFGVLIDCFDFSIKSKYFPKNVEVFDNN